MLARLPFFGGGVGLLFLIVSALLGIQDSQRFFYSYLAAYLYFLTVALGGLIFVLLQFATRAGWSVVVRRLAEHVMGTLPFFLLLFIPLLFGIHSLYEWSHAEAVAHDALLQHKSPYLNAEFFYLRSVVYLLVWSVMAWWFRRRSLDQDEKGDPALTRKLQTFSPVAILVFGITLTFASFDWIMSLDPHWYSTIFGVYIFAGSFVAILAFLILLSLLVRRGGVLQDVITTEHFHDLGKLLFAFVVFWAYIAFSQFMLIWYANIPEETIWFAHRWQHGWEYLSVFLAGGHFVLPFLFLLSRDVKRSRPTLAIAAGWMLLMHYVDIYWLVMPSLQREAVNPALLDLTAFLAIGGLFSGLLGLLMQKSALVPMRDPRLSESLSFENM